MFEKLKNNIFITFLLLLIVLSVVSFSLASTPNPGHPWSTVGDGNFSVVGPTQARTYTFPDISTTILTSNTTLLTPQGGTGEALINGILVGNQGFALNSFAKPDGLLVGDTDNQALSNKTFNSSYNTFSDTGLTAGDLFKSNGTKFLRFATTTPVSYLRTNLAGTDIEWVTLSAGPGGADKQVQYNNGGSSWGATSSLVIDSGVLKIDNKINLNAIALQPVASTGTLRFFSRAVSGREMIQYRTDEASDYSVLQPNLFNNYYCLVRPSAGATVTNQGCTASGTGTVTSSSTENDGYTVRGTFTATISSVYSSTPAFFRGSTNTGQNGFFYFARMSFPDATYDDNSGVRILCGLSDQAGSASCGSDNVTNQDMVAFIYSTALSANWRVATDDGAAAVPNYVDTGIPFSGGKVWDFYLYSPSYPNNSTIYWRIDNLTDGTTAEGNTNTRLPGATVALNIQACLKSNVMVTRNWRMSVIYGEVPR